MNTKLKEYYAGDELAPSVWLGKYGLKNELKEVVEETPRDMHWRMALELARAEEKYPQTYEDKLNGLSNFGKNLPHINVDFIFKYFDRFKYIIPQGSIMSGLGNKYKVLSLSNCFVVPAPLDSYGGIFYTDQSIAQLEKRRGGVGTNLNSLRPEEAPVLNSAGTSTGAHSFMERYSNTTREVAQKGRRGALMLLMSVLHPDIFKFVTKKKDRTKVTGANISTQLTNEFMKAVEADEDFYCRFPIDAELPLNIELLNLPYNELKKINSGGEDFIEMYVMRIKAKELFDLIVEMAWENAEPGVAYMDNVINYSPEGVYPQFRPIASNPCGEQWMQAYDACRLFAANLFSFVVNPFTPEAHIDYDKIYEVFYIQQRLADDIVDLEIEYVTRIIDKIKSDPEPDYIKAPELILWTNIKKTAQASRRTGCGITGLADMLAAMNLKYDSEEALQTIEKVMKKKMEGELDCTIDLAILRGTFEGWDNSKEFGFPEGDMEDSFGRNDFYDMMIFEFPEITKRMWKYGRRNVSWSTIAPTGSLSIITILTKYPNISSGMEPHFLPYFFRNKKINPSDKDARVDFTDQNGDAWQVFPVMMGGFKEWYEAKFRHVGLEASTINGLKKDEIEQLFKQSPYYGACANDISWEQRLKIQALLQKYTTNAISSTLNLPKDVTKETVANIYKLGHKLGLKGVTIYRDGCRTGVLNAESKVNTSSFDYRDAIKRPQELEGDLNIVTVKGIKYGVIVGMLDGKPYEVFAFDLRPEIQKECRGTITKVKKGRYDFTCPEGVIKNIQKAAIHTDEALLTRMVSGMLRHGAKPQFVMEQIDKVDLVVGTYGKALTRVLKKYVSEEELLKRNRCKDCGSENLKLQEGCLTCLDCGSSKCG
jgi:ribonucleoside-diphosphate reductase alpha chain